MICKLYTKGNHAAHLKRVTDALQDGGVVILPTDTVYALCCSALKERAVERVCRLKNIDPAKSRLSVVCYDMSAIGEYAKLDNASFKLMRRNLPGPFTFILNASHKLPRLFRNRREVGFRMPDNDIVRQVANALGCPLMVSSLPLAPDDETEYLTNPELIDERWGGLVDWVVDGGTGGLAHSTVVDCTQGAGEVIRPGLGELTE